jgi:hypothetical protein
MCRGVHELRDQGPVTVRNIPPEIRSLFTDAEIAEIAAHAVPFTDERKLDAIDLSIAWESRVRKIDLDRTLPWSDRSVWNEHDLAGTLFIRDFLQDALDQLPPSLRERLERWVEEADDRFRSYTVDDPAGRMAVIADVDLTERPWWWHRVPASGPIVEDLTRYSGGSGA